MLHRTLFVVLVTIPCVMSRHIEHSESRRETPVNENVHRDDNNDERTGLPRTHLRLHSKPPRVLQTTEGSNEILECQAGGSPLPRIYWMKNGRQVSQIDPIDEARPKATNDEARLDIGSTSSRLYLDCGTTRDRDEYTCVAENAYHREGTTTTVRVASSTSDEGCTKKDGGQAPRILTWTKTALENQGQDLRVVCRVEGEPRPRVQWLNPREDRIEENAKFQISMNGDLLIRNLKWKDMGNYICVAENIHGTARAEAFVYPATPET
ncbi:hypothetical protein JTE90_002045 [Oedothorax gibbosus]|uniref:Ig-like domain-containing protein n=1 Tax=Oedothorax gibbosus TaxID=931172 RepID=A0AAV6UNZ4_9ARAC|nr:hypothetical protein JTE90_002045 [Oedothorax gibbosus]